jgi:hypothetical protein
LALVSLPGHEPELPPFAMASRLDLRRGGIFLGEFKFETVRIRVTYPGTRI